MTCVHTYMPPYVHMHTDVHGLLKLYMICVCGEVIGIGLQSVLQSCVFRSKYAMLRKVELCKVGVVPIVKVICFELLMWKLLLGSAVLLF